VKDESLEEKERIPQSLSDFGFPFPVFHKNFSHIFLFIIYIVKDVIGM